MPGVGAPPTPAGAVRRVVLGGGMRDEDEEEEGEGLGIEDDDDEGGGMSRDEGGDSSTERSA